MEYTVPRACFGTPYPAVYDYSRAILPRRSAVLTADRFGSVPMLFLGACGCSPAWVVRGLTARLASPKINKNKTRLRCSSLCREFVNHV
jgi:hypothetical protein